MENTPVFTIAEIGSNHDGDFDKARALIDAAGYANADAVKFQTYRAENLVDPTLPTLPHVRKLYKTQYERFKSLEFNASQWEELAHRASQKGLEFLSTPFDKDSADMLSPLVNRFKVASGDANNFHLIRYLLTKQKPLIVSTGMLTEEELKQLTAEIPKDKLTLMHCVSLYPTPIDKANLATIAFLKAKYEVPVGYSDHTKGISACQYAVALGASIIEKHFTLDSSQKLGDHPLSVEPDEMKIMVERIRECSQMVGLQAKMVTEEERNMAKAMRRGLAAARKLSKGEILKFEDLLPLRPESEIPVNRLDDVIGKQLLVDKDQYEFFKPDELS